jgi:hypothetical protein
LFVIGRGDGANIAPFQFGKEVAGIHSLVAARRYGGF